MTDEDQKVKIAEEQEKYAHEQADKAREIAKDKHQEAIKEIEKTQAGSM